MGFIEVPNRVAASGEPGSHSLYRDAYNHMFHTGDLLAGAIAKQQKLK